MVPNRDRILTVLRALFVEARVEQVTFMAGSIAYHAFVSLLPLLLLVLAAISAVGSSSLEDGLFALTEAVLTPGASNVLVTELESANQTTGVSVLGGLLLIWGTLRIFRGLDTAFSDIYESSEANSFADQIIDGVVVLFAVAFAVVVAALVETRLGGLDSVPGGWFAKQFVLVFGLFVVLFPMYFVFPDQEGMRLREAVPGTAVAAVGLTVFQALFGLYIEVSSRAPRESILAGILVFLTWLYFSGLVVLLGAVVNAVLTNRSDDISISPVIGGPPDEQNAASDTIDTQLQSLQRRLTAAEECTLSVDGESVTLPAPNRVVVDEGSPHRQEDTQTVLHLDWTPEREQAANEQS